MAAPATTPVRTVDVGRYELTIATHAGPRLVGFRRSDGAQLFADLPDLMLEHPGIPDYALLGGHRLWRAPEVPAVTYEADDRPVSIEVDAGTITVEGAPESDGLVKRLTISSSQGYVIVEHELRNDAWAPVECAPWAITQLVLGGFAVLPQTMEPTDAHGVQPNRSIVLWPYTDPGAAEISWRREMILIAGSSDPAPIKVGQPNDRGWIAYAAADELFVKWTDRHDPDLTYLDRDATMQVYRNDRFVELETMGRLSVIAPGNSLRHREVWAIFEIGPADAATLPVVISSLDLPSVPELA